MRESTNCRKCGIEVNELNTYRSDGGVCKQCVSEHARQKRVDAAAIKIADGSYRFTAKWTRAMEQEAIRLFTEGQLSINQIAKSIGSSGDTVNGHLKKLGLHRTKEQSSVLRRISKTEGDKKECPGCNEFLPLSEFYNHAHRYDGKGTKCKSCADDEQLFKRHGITRAEFLTIYESQDGRCPVCNKDLPSATNSADMHVDHDHAFGKVDHGNRNAVRGLLHVDCNLGIGRLGDSVENCLRAARYLSNPPARKVLRVLPSPLPESR